MKKQGKIRRSRWSKRVKIAVIAGAVVVAGLVGLGVWTAVRTHDTDIDSSKYQGVFLANGQVYFGKLTLLGNNYMKLTNVFYIQGKTDTENPQQTTDNGSDVQLIKLGNEVHGPQDEMVINKDQVLFYENLMVDSKVSQIIDKYGK